MSNRNGAPAKSTTQQDPLLDIHAVAQALGITPRHVQRLVAERRIPFLKVGRFVRFDPAYLNLWLEAQRVEPVRPACSRVDAPRR
jgi:excisionase family DNA binding protein